MTPDTSVDIARRVRRALGRYHNGCRRELYDRPTANPRLNQGSFEVVETLLYGCVMTLITLQAHYKQLCRAHRALRRCYEYVGWRKRNLADHFLSHPGTLPNAKYEETVDVMVRK